MRLYEHPRVNWMRHLGEDSSQSSSTDEAAKVYTAPWLCRKGLGDGCSMMMHDATMWNDRYGLVGFGLVCYVWLGLFGSFVLFVLFCFVYFLACDIFGEWLNRSVTMSMCQNFRLKYPSTCWIGCFAWFWQVMNQDFVFGFQDIIRHGFACICICCVCGIKLYFILPLSLQFFYYVIA